MLRFVRVKKSSFKVLAKSRVPLAPLQFCGDNFLVGGKFIVNSEPPGIITCSLGGR